jgi:acyl-CoA synthetase (AMP-forming)/AMP-acid ligase II
MNPFAGKTYAQAIADLAGRYGTREALVFRGRRWSFAEAKREIDSASARLAALALEPGDTVAIWMPNRPEFLWYWFGASQAGFVTVFLNTRLRREEFRYQIAQSDARVVLIPGSGAFRDFLGELGEVCPELRSGRPGALASAEFPRLRYVIACDEPEGDWPGVLDWSVPPEGAPMPPLATDHDAPALIAYSSGTTALPKGAMLTHCIWRKAYDGGRYLGLGPEDRLYLCVPLFGVLGSLNGILTFWAHGACVVLDERFDATRCLASLVEERCTAMHFLPPMVNALLEHPRRHEYPHRLRVGVVLSSDPKILRTTATELGVPGVVTGYGLTESTGLVTRCRWDEPLETRLESQGRPLPDCFIRVVDPETGQDMPPGEPGEIWIGGYSVMPGYYNKPEETRRSITPDGWLRSGDLGALRADGTLVFHRRLKDGYKHKGFNVSTPEVEHAIAQHPAVASVAVVGIPHPEFGEVGVAFIIPRAGQVVEPDDLFAFLRPRLASFKLPAHVLTVDAFPVTGGTEKIQKYRLREIAIERLQGAASAAAAK